MSTTAAFAHPRSLSRKGALCREDRCLAGVPACEPDSRRRNSDQQLDIPFCAIVVLPQPSHSQVLVSPLYGQTCSPSPTLEMEFRKSERSSGISPFARIRSPRRALSTYLVARWLRQASSTVRVRSFGIAYVCDTQRYKGARAECRSRLFVCQKSRFSNP